MKRAHTPAESTRDPGRHYLYLDCVVSTADPLAAAGSLCLHLCPLDNEALEVSIGGRTLPVIRFPQGTVALAHLVNLMSETAAPPTKPVRVYIQRAVFDELTDGYGVPRLEGLTLTTRRTDTVLANLQACLQECIQGRDATASELIRHLTQAIHCHIAHVYGGVAIPDEPSKGGLARWQLRVAVHHLDRLLDRGRPPLSQIARSCGLSVSHFSRAFAQSTGLSPTRWSQRRRIDRAKELLRSSSLPLLDISQACGFADQSNFSNQFSKASGMTPARWRARNQDQLTRDEA